MKRRILAHSLRFAGIAIVTACACAITLFGGRADSPPKYGDLTHLTFTATGSMPVTFVYPSDHMAAPGIATQVSVKTVKGAGIELKINGEVVPARNLGRMAVSKEGTQYDFYGVMLRPGPNTLTITSIGAAGIRGQSQSETVFGPGPPARVTVSLMGRLIADGKSRAYLLVDALDQWNHPAMAGAQVHVAILSGSATIGTAIGAVALPSAPPTQAPQQQQQSQAQYELGSGGRIQIPIVASLVPGTLQVQAGAGDASDTESFTIAPYLRPAFVNGVVSVGAGSVPIAVDGDGRYDGGGARKTRVAIFGSGKAGANSALTFAYESQNRLMQSSSLGPFVQDPNERPYQTYGDSSVVSSDFQSQDRLYARLDNGRNNVMWGEYIATAGSADGVGRFAQQLSGAKAELGLGAPGRGSVTAFTARNPNAFVSIAVPVTGLSALMQPLHADIVVGSDEIALVALDRRSGAVVSQTPLSRNADYTIDYATGVLRFLNIPMPFDEHFNPQVLYIRYEYQGTGARSITSGFDFSYAIDRSGSTKFEAGYVNDATGMANYALASETLSGKTASGQWVFSHAESGGAVPSIGNLATASSGSARGSAMQFSYNGRLAGNQVALEYQNNGAGFANPFGGFNVNGLESVTASLTRRFARDRSSLQIQAGEQRNSGSGTASVEDNVSAQLRTMIGSALAMTLGLQAQHETDGPAAVVSGAQASTPQTVTGSNAQLQAGLSWKPAKRLNVSVDHQAQLGGNSSVLPSQTGAEVAYELPGEGRVYLRELFGGAQYTFAQATSSYTAPVIGGRSTQIGVQRTIGSGTAIDTSYAIADTDNGTNLYAALGVQQTFKIGQRLTGNATMQSARATGTGAQGFTVFGTGLSYTDLKDFRASLSMQSRGGQGGGMTISGGATGHLGPDFAMLGTVQQTFGNGTSAVDDRVSVAYRNNEDDRFLSLFGYDRTSGSFGAIDGKSNVLSFDEFYRPAPSTEIAGRFAYKLDGDGYYLAHTGLASLRLRQNLSSRFDIGAELRKSNAANIPGARATDFAAELGYQVGSAARVAGGYNFSGSVDPTLTGHPQRRGFYLTVTTLVDRIFGWGKQ